MCALWQLGRCLTIQGGLLGPCEPSWTLSVLTVGAAGDLTGAGVVGRREAAPFDRKDG